MKGGCGQQRAFAVRLTRDVCSRPLNKKTNEQASTHTRGINVQVRGLRTYSATIPTLDMPGKLEPPTRTRARECEERCTSAAFRHTFHEELRPREEGQVVDAIHLAESCRDKKFAGARVTLRRGSKQMAARRYAISKQPLKVAEKTRVPALLAPR